MPEPVDINISNDVEFEPLWLAPLKGIHSVELLEPSEIARIEKDFAEGLPAATILKIFRPKGMRLSEATFRKYVQAGLLPRSRRVGSKGKHRGIRGMYPVESVRRINAIKKMMAAGMTLEDIKHSFVFLRNHLDLVERGFTEVFEGLLQEMGARNLERTEHRALKAELTTLRRRARALVEDVARLGSALTARPVGEGAAGAVGT